MSLKTFFLKSLFVSLLTLVSIVSYASVETGPVPPTTAFSVQDNLQGQRYEGFDVRAGNNGIMSGSSGSLGVIPWVLVSQACGSANPCTVEVSLFVNNGGKTTEWLIANMIFDMNAYTLRQYVPVGNQTTLTKSSDGTPLLIINAASQSKKM